jgi:hypothetical protein
VGEENGLEAVTPEAASESSREAKIAIAIDGGAGQDYLLLENNMPLRSFKEREQLLLKGLSVEPGSASANWGYIIQILAASGRREDAIRQARSAWHLVPFTSWVAICLPQTLANAGRIDEARNAIAEMKRKWPESSDPSFEWVEFLVESQRAPFERALALLDDSDFRNLLEQPPYGKPGATDVMRTAMKAQVGPPGVKQTAAQLVEKAADDRAINTFWGISILSSLGDVDGAFRTADRDLPSERFRHLFSSDVGNSIYLLFGIQTIEMRRDRRFMPLAQRLGLVEYWRSTGHWPDFCSEPGLPYDCMVEGAKLKN